MGPHHPPASMLFVVLLACSGSDAPMLAPPTDPDVPGDTDTGPAGDTGEPTETAVDRALERVTLDPAQVGTLLADTLSTGIPEPWSPRGAYLEAWTAADEDCPQVVEAPEVFVVPRQWSDDCTTASGWHFAGNATYEERMEDGGRAFFMDIASFQITRPDGSVFSGSGGFVVLDEPGGWSGLLAGSWSDTGRSDWLARGMSGGFDVFAEESRTELSGGVRIGSQPLFFEDLVVDPTGAVVSGRIGLRDPSGDWWWFAPDRTGCGAISLAGSELTQACIDTEVLVVADGSTP